MKKILLTVLILAGLAGNLAACHYSYLTLLSGPTAIGGGRYRVSIQVCIGQAANWGGTSSFSLCFSGASPVAGTVIPSTVINNYVAGQNGPFGCPQIGVSASASASTSGSCVNYNTTSSTPAGFPLVGDRQDVGAASAGNTNSFCFNLTVDLNGYPTSVNLGGIETNESVYCAGGDGILAPCNGTPEADETLNFAPLPAGSFLSISGEPSTYGNILRWSTEGLQPKKFHVMRVDHGEDLLAQEILANGDGDYSFIDSDYHEDLNSYYVKVFDPSGQVVYTTNSVLIFNTGPVKVVKMYNIMGQKVDSIEPGKVTLLIYSDNTVRKIVTQ